MIAGAGIILQFTVADQAIKGPVLAEIVVRICFGHAQERADLVEAYCV